MLLYFHGFVGSVVVEINCILTAARSSAGDPFSYSLHALFMQASLPVSAPEDMHGLLY